MFEIKFCPQCGHAAKWNAGRYVCDECGFEFMVKPFEKFIFGMESRLKAWNEAVRDWTKPRAQSKPTEFDKGDWT